MTRQNHLTQSQMILSDFTMTSETVQSSCFDAKGILNDGFAGCIMALTVPVLSKFPTTARITSVSSGINLAYGQVDGRLVIGDDEISISQVNCMYEFPYGDLLVGTTESLQIFRDGKEISSSAHETGIESISGRGNMLYVLMAWAERT